MELLEGLNAAQREAVLSTEGFVRVIAGAGSGKTRALTRRFAYLVTELGILPGNLLCVTFTNKAANEMRQRIHNLTGDEDTGYINTFHGFCVSILQEDSHAVGYPKSFLVLDNSDIDAMLQIIYEERGLTLRDMTFSHARDMIEMLKLKERPAYYEDMLTLPLDTLKEKYWKAENAKDIIFYGYLYQEKKCFALDYNDLIVFSLHIFRTHEDIRLKWQKRLEYIMIDEFQDIDPPQYALMQVLCEYHKNLFIVGDPDQTIYTWRGADVRYLLDFDKIYPTTKTIMMMENYRSTPEILAACNSLISKNANRIKKDLLPMLPGGAPVLCHHAANSEQEARWIAAQIKTLHKAGTPYRDMAVLYRAHYITRGVEEILLKEKIPYTIYSGVQFFARAEIKDALSYLRMIACRDDLSFLRIANVPKRNLGERRMAFLKDYAAQNGCSLYDALRRNLDSELLRGTKGGKFVSLIESFTGIYDQMPVSELLAAVLNESGYEAMLRTEGSQMRLDNLAELKVGLCLRDDLRRGMHAGALSGARRAVHKRRSRRSARSGAAHDRPQREGTGIPARVPVRDERGHFPVEKDADAARHGGGTTAVLRRHDACTESALPVRGRGAQSGRQPALSVALPAGYRRFAFDLYAHPARGSHPAGAGIHRLFHQTSGRKQPAAGLRPRHAGPSRRLRAGHGSGA